MQVSAAAASQRIHFVQLAHAPLSRRDALNSAKQTHTMRPENVTNEKITLAESEGAFIDI